MYENPQQEGVSWTASGHPDTGAGRTSHRHARGRSLPAGEPAARHRACRGGRRRPGPRGGAPCGEGGGPPRRGPAAVEAGPPNRRFPETPPPRTPAGEPTAGTPTRPARLGPPIVRSRTRRRDHDPGNAHGPTPPACRGRYRTTKPGACGAGKRAPAPHTPRRAGRGAPRPRSPPSGPSHGRGSPRRGLRTTPVMRGGERQHDTRVAFHVADLGPSPEVGADDVLAVQPDGASPAAHRHGRRSRDGRATRTR